MSVATGDIIQEVNQAIEELLMSSGRGVGYLKYPPVCHATIHQGSSR